MSWQIEAVLEIIGLVTLFSFLVAFDRGDRRRR